MPRADYKRCRDCGGHVRDVGTLSHERLCVPCWNERLCANNLQISAGVGPYAERRRYGMVAAEFGPRVAHALRKAGVIGPDPVDVDRLSA